MSPMNRVQRVVALGMALLVPVVATGEEADWFVETTDSAVYGKRHMAATASLLPSDPTVRTEISVICVEGDRDVSVKFLITAEDENRSPAFATEFSRAWDSITVVGGARTGLTEGVVSAAHFVRLTTFSNEVELFSGRGSTFLSNNSHAWNVLGNLPIALALETSVGEVEFVVPRDPAVVAVLQKCATGDRPEIMTTDQFVARAKAEKDAVARQAAQDAEVARKAIPDRGVTIVKDTMFRPIYPAKEARDGIGGEVVLRVSVDAQGMVSDVQVERSSGNSNLDRSAMATARRWRYLPAVQDGHPVDAGLLVPITFTPQQ